MLYEWEKNLPFRIGYLKWDYIKKVNSLSNGNSVQPHYSFQNGFREWHTTADMNLKSDAFVQAASCDDIEVLAKHHRCMFEEIWAHKKIPFDPELMRTMESNYIEKLRIDLKSGSCHAWIIYRNDRILSSGAVSMCSYVPVPHDPSSQIAFLHSIYTEPEERGKGYARAITKHAIEYCKQNKIARLYLFASESGRIIYENEGFVSVDNTMMKLIK